MKYSSAEPMNIPLFIADWQTLIEGSVLEIGGLAEPGKK